MATKTLENLMHKVTKVSLLATLNKRILIESKTKELNELKKTSMWYFMKATMEALA